MKAGNFNENGEIPTLSVMKKQLSDCCLCRQPNVDIPMIAVSGLAEIVYTKH